MAITRSARGPNCASGTRVTLEVVSRASSLTSTVTPAAARCGSRAPALSATRTSENLPTNAQVRTGKAMAALDLTPQSPRRGLCNMQWKVRANAVSHIFGGYWGPRARKLA